MLRSFSSQDEFSDSRTDILSAGPLAGPLRRVFRCQSSSSEFSLPETVFALTDDTLVYRPGPCARAAEGFVALDLVAGARETVPQPYAGNVTDLEAEGPFVSYALQTEGFAREYVVYDRATHAEALKVTLPAGQDIIASGLQGDGKIVLLTRKIATSDDGCRGYTLSWYSVVEPFAHDLDVGVCRGPAEIAGDRIVFTSAEPLGSALSVTDLAADSRQLADFGGSSFALDTMADRVTYALGNCAGGADFFVQPFDGTFHEGPPPPCPVRIGSQRLRASARDRIRVRLACTRGCHGRVRLRGLDGRKLAEQRFQIGRGGRKTVAMRLNRRGRLRLRRAGRLRIAIKTLTADRDFRNRISRQRAVLIPRSE